MLSIAVPSAILYDALVPAELKKNAYGPLLRLLEEMPKFSIFSIILLDPLLETFLLIGALKLSAYTTRFLKPSNAKDWIPILITALGFATLHGIANLRVLMIFPIGVFLTKAIVDWRNWHSLRMGFLASFILHALNNFTVIILYYVGRHFT